MKESRKAYENPSWKKVRLTVLKRDDYRCVNVNHSVQHEGSETLHVHHLVPKSAGGTDELSNLCTLCSGCHALFHMNLQASLSRRVIERWAFRLARWLDITNQIPKSDFSFGPVLRLLGISSFRPGQLEVVLTALRGESVLFVSPTGSGKSLCFQVPTLLKSGFSLVITPLKALMQDQVRSLQEKTIPASYINSDLSKQEKESRYKMLDNKCLKFLYCAPERFGKRVNSKELMRLRKLRPSWLVIDEVHVVPKWAKGFRPDYSKLASIHKTVGNPPVLAFTATATRKTQARILNSLNIPNAKVFVRDITRPNIALLKVKEKSLSKRINVVLTLINKTQGKTMIFVPTIKIGAEVAKGFKSKGIDIPFYYSRLNTIKRESIFNRFIGLHRPEIDTVICTNAFGMGVDLPNIKAVVHWQHPASIEDYVQEFGRAGRDGKPSKALLFTSDNDYGLQKFMIEKTLDSTRLSNIEKKTELEYQIQRLEEMSQYSKQDTGCLRKAIRSYFEEDPDIEKKKPLSVQILNFIFSSKKRRSKKSICCSNCKPRLISDLTRSNNQRYFE